MNKEIRILNVAIPVIDIYPYTYNYGDGKEVIRIKVQKTDCSYQVIEDTFQDLQSDIEYYVDNELVTKYKNFYNDFKCSYENGQYSIEMTKVSNKDIAIAQLQSVVDTLLIESLGGVK